jgi:hypothetical protein
MKNTITEFSHYYNAPVLRYEHAIKLICELIKNGHHFHYDEDPTDIINLETGKRVFSDYVAEELRQRMEEMFALDWTHSVFDDPFDAGLYLMKAFEAEKTYNVKILIEAGQNAFGELMPRGEETLTVSAPTVGKAKTIAMMKTKLSAKGRFVQFDVVEAPRKTISRTS